MRRLLPCLALSLCLAAPAALAGDDYKCTVTGTGVGNSVSTCVSEDTAESFTTLGSGFWLLQCNGVAKVRGDTEAGRSAVSVGVELAAGQLYPLGRFTGAWFLNVAAAAGVVCEVYVGEAQ